MTTKLERTERALDAAMGYIKENPHIGNQLYINQIDTILNPPPEMEEVEVVKWGAIWPDGRMSDGLWDTEDEAKERTNGPNGQGEPLMMKGFVQRPKPRKVERSETIENVQMNDVGRLRYNMIPMIVFTRAKRKIVTLTATWEE